MRRLAVFAALGALLAISLQTPTAAQGLKEVKITIPRASIVVLNYLGARDAGIFQKHGIDLKVDVRPFPGFIASLPTRETFVGNHPGLEGIDLIAQGRDLVVIGGGLTVMQDVYVRKDSAVKTVADLRGKRFGVWSTGAGAAKSLRALAIDAANIDLWKDAQLVELAPPALMALLDRGEVEAMYNISSLSIRAASEPWKYRPIFVPNTYWKRKAGSTVAWSSPLMAWRDWVQADPARARSMVAAVHESYEWLARNVDAAVEKYGELAALTDPGEITVARVWLKEGRIFLSKWDQKTVDAQWAFLELAYRVGVIERVPPKDRHGLVLR